MPSLQDFPRGDRAVSGWRVLANERNPANLPPLCVPVAAPPGLNVPARATVLPVTMTTTGARVQQHHQQPIGHSHL